MSSSPRSLRLFPILLVLLATGPASAAASPGREVGTSGPWQALPGLADLRFAQARNVEAGVRTGRHEIALDGGIAAEGRLFDRVVIGPGWVQASRTRGRDAASVPPSDSGSERVASRPGPRVDVLSGEAVRVDGPVLVEPTPLGLAVRWTRLATPLGPAVVELHWERTGRVTVQYLRLPGGTSEAILDGRLVAGAVGGRPSAGVLPATATSFGLELSSSWQPRVPDPEPFADGPPPAGCDPAAGDWCLQAGGGVPAVVYLNESFDDGMAAARGWTATGQWTEVTHADCPPGASRDPGRAFYYGDVGSCRYANNSTGDLTSMTFGPITGTTRLMFSYRGAWENGFDLAEVYINGELNGGPASPPDPDLWYTTNPINLSAYAGQVIDVAFRFSTDSNQVDTGWFVDDVIVWDDAVGQPECIFDAQVGRRDVTLCSETQATQWSFNERGFCQGCEYTFYVVVECGREMHLPLLDMEGAEVAITDVISGLPVPLRCWNETAKADAGLGPYKVLLRQDCCGGGGDEEWWAPAFDRTDNVGPGTVRWGLPSCPDLSNYDVTGDGQPDCSALPGCGGDLPLVTPGESQLMDCFISADEGLCGLFRVDVTSGGFAWDLFANCDGSTDPRFPIFHDCTEAWDAYEPLPELAIDNLRVSDGCPNVTVDFDIVNLGCEEQVDGITVRLVSDCDPGETRDQVLPGPFPVGVPVAQSLPFSTACSPVRVEVFVDPDDAVLECSERPGSASCDAETGLDSLADFACGCAAGLVADAGAPTAACGDATITLDGSGSTIDPCAMPEYRWLDSSGAVLRDWSPDPIATVAFGGCPDPRDFVLEIRCNGELCVERTTVTVDCQVPNPNAGPDAFVCPGGNVTVSGSRSTIPGCAALEYRWSDPAGAVVQDWSTEPDLEILGPACADLGDYTLDVRCAATGECFGSDTVRVDCMRVNATVIENPVLACESVRKLIDEDAVMLDLLGCTDVEYRWSDADSGDVFVEWSPVVDLAITFNDCPGMGRLLFEVRCADAGAAPCPSSTIVDLECPEPIAPVPSWTEDCGGTTASLRCGAAEAGVSYFWDLDASVDSDGDGDPNNDPDLLGCDVMAAWPDAGTKAVRAWAEHDAAGCRVVTPVAIEIHDDPIAPTAAATPGCVGASTLLDCTANEAGVTYEWDLDVSVDSDSNGTADDDVDLVGCQVLPEYAAGSWTAKVVARDAQGCSAEDTVTFDVVLEPAPGEATNLRVGHSGGQLDLAWDGTPDADTYRVLRGVLGDWYGFGADDAVGRGTCDTGGAVSWSDPNDAALSGDWYYLVVAGLDCGLDGSAGRDSSGTERPGRVPTVGCP